MRIRKVLAAALALGLGVGASLLGALPASAEPIVSLDDPGVILTTATELDFSGTTETSISAITITFADETSGTCEVSQPDPDTWTCSYIPTSTLAAGQGQLYFEFVDELSAPETENFTVQLPDPVVTLDEHATYYDVDTELSFTGTTNRSDISGIGITFADASIGSCDLFGSEDPTQWACGASIGTGLPVGDAILEFSFDGGGSAEQVFTVYPALTFDTPGPFFSTDSSIGFSGNSAVFTVDSATITFSDDSTPDCGLSSEGSLWSCSDSDGPGFPAGPGHLDVIVTGEVSKSYSLPFTVFDDNGTPDISSYLFSPGALTVTGDPTPPATVMGTQVYFLDGEEDVAGCPDLNSEEEGGDFPGVAPGHFVCNFPSLHSGPWEVVSYQDIGDGGTEAAASVSEQFFIPEAPVIDTVSGNSANALTIAGGVGAAPPYYYSPDYRALPGDFVSVYNGAAALCTAVVQEDGTWSCTTADLPGGSYSIRAAARDNGDCECGYLRGGLSSLSTPDFSVTLPTLSTGGGDTLPTTGTTVTPPALIWTFDLKGLDLNHVHPGDKFTITGAGLPAGSVITIELHSTPITLGTVTVAPDGTFSLSGTIPANVDPGAHHIVATLTGPGLTPTAVDKAITIEADSTPSTSTGATTGANSDSGSSEHNADSLHDPATAPNILTDSLNPIAEVITDPGRIPAAFAAGLVLLLFAIMPAHLLNATLGEQYERFARRVPQLRNRPRWFAGVKAALDKAPVLGGVIITAITGFLFAFADPTFGFNLHSLRLVLALGAALFAVTYLANAITALIMRRAWDVDVVVSIRPLGLVLTVVGVIVSRIMDFSPGFLIGLVLGLSIASHSAAKQAWKAVLIRTSVIAVFGIAAWVIYSTLAPGVHQDPTFTNELVLELFVAIATEGVVMMLIELLPFHLLEGERLYKRSRVLWGASYLLLLVVFLLAVVPWEGNWRELGESFWPWFTAVAIFGVVCVSIYLYFRFLAPHDEEDGDHDASLEDDQERIAVGDD